jgi:hypothetical protein
VIEMIEFIKNTLRDTFMYIYPDIFCKFQLKSLTVFFNNQFCVGPWNMNFITGFSSSGKLLLKTNNLETICKM